MGRLTKAEAIEIARAAALALPAPYMKPGWLPHRWVLSAIMRAYRMGQKGEKPEWFYK